MVTDEAKPEVEVVKEVASEAEVDPKALCSLKGRDKLGAIIPKNKNKVVEEPITSLSKKYKRLKEIPGELIINPSLPPHKQVTSLSSSRKRKALELEPEVYIAGLEAFQRISDIHKVEVESLLGYMVMVGNVNTLKNQSF
ncbi:hypothetical protein Tco_1306484, partial [Tanacetum coccineum]